MADRPNYLARVSQGIKQLGQSTRMAQMRVRSSYNAYQTKSLTPMPRHLEPGGIRSIPPSIPLDASGEEASVQFRDGLSTANPKLIRQLALMDPIVWAIKKAIISTVNQMHWDIVPCVDDQFNDLDRWFDQCSDFVDDENNSLPRKPFESAYIDPEIIADIEPRVEKILGSDDNPRDKRFQLETLFRVVKNDIDQTAFIHCAIVKPLFHRPNNNAETSFRALLNYLVDDLLLFDAGILVKGYNWLGQIVELYTLPGNQVCPIMYPDLTVPQPPYAAYAWETENNKYALFTNTELTYMMENPQRNLYGYSPVEALMYVSTATILGDKAYISELTEGPVPPGIINLGNVSQNQRARFEAALQQNIKASGGQKLMVVGDCPTEDGKYQIDWVPKIRDMQSMALMGYLSLTPAIKAVAFGLSPADIPIVINPQAPVTDVAQQISQSRGVLSRVDTLENYINAEICKQEFPFKDVMLRFDRSTGKDMDSVDCATADSIRIANGSLTRNESRKKLSQRPIVGGNIPTIITGNQVIQVDVLSPNMGDVEPGLFPGAPQAPAVVGAGVTPTISDPANPENKPLANKRNNASDRKTRTGQ